MFSAIVDHFTSIDQPNYYPIRRDLVSVAQQSTTLNIKAPQLTLAQQVDRIKQGYAKLESMQIEQGQAHTRCYVCLYGGTNTGKSSLFNLILGTEVSAVKATASATKSAVVSIPERLADLSKLHPKDLWLKNCVPLQKPDDPLHVLEAKQQFKKSVAYLHTRTQDSQLYQSLDPEQCLVLIDTPDHDSHQLEHQQSARAVLPHCDLCVYVTSSQKYKHQSTITELLYILNQGLKVGVVFNMLDSHQDLDLIWQDLQEQLTRAAIDETRTKTRVSIKEEYIEGRQVQAHQSPPSPNDITLLGSLPVIHGLKQADNFEKREISQAIFIALRTLFVDSTPYQYMQKEAQKQSRTQLYAIQRLLEQAQDAEAGHPRA